MPRIKFTTLSPSGGAAPQFGDPGINGLLVIEVGPAKGHFCYENEGHMVAADPSDPALASKTFYPVFIDQTTIAQLHESAMTRGEIKSKLKHADVDDLIGGYKNFRLDTPDRLRADLVFLQKLPGEQKDFIIELAQRFATEIGNSVDFDPYFETGVFPGSGQKVALARCQKLNSVDIVDTPAATSGLFERKNLTLSRMPLDKEVLDAISENVGTQMKSFMDTHSAAMQKLTERLSKYDDENKDDDTDEGKKKKEEAAEADAEKMAARLLPKLTGKLSIPDEKISLSVGKVVKEQLHALTGGRPLNLGDPTETAKSDMQGEVERVLALGLKDVTNVPTALRFIAAQKPAIYNKWSEAGRPQIKLAR